MVIKHVHLVVQFKIERVASAPITNHKTGNTIQIVSQELSALVHKSWRRR